MKKFSDLFFIFVGFLLLMQSLDAHATSRISCKNPTYANQNIRLFFASDAILQKEENIAISKFSNQGYLSLEIEKETTCEVFFRLGNKKFQLFIEPNKEYNIELPNYEAIDSIRAKSIYFKYDLYTPTILNVEKMDINVQAKQFDYLYQNTIHEKYNLLFLNKSIETALQIIKDIESKYKTNTDLLFKSYRNSQYTKLISSISNSITSKECLEQWNKFSLNFTLEQWNNNLNQTFSNYLFKRYQGGDTFVLQQIKQQSFNKLVKHFQDIGFNSELASYVVLKGLVDAYYTSSFNKKQIWSTIENAQYSSNFFIKRKAIEILSILAKQKEGNICPNITLTNSQTGEKIDLRKLTGKFVYLVFLNTQSSSYKTISTEIENMRKELNKILSPILILDKKVPNLEAVYYTTSFDNIEEKLYIKETPYFILLSPEGKIVNSPAKSPSEGFIPYFLRTYRNYAFKNQK